MYRVSVQRRLLSFVAMVLVQTLVHTLADDSAWQHAKDRGLIARDAIRSRAEKRRHEPRIYFRRVLPPLKVRHEPLRSLLGVTVAAIRSRDLRAG